MRQNEDELESVAHNLTPIGLRRQVRGRNKRRTMLFICSMSQFIKIKGREKRRNKIRKRKILKNREMKSER